MGKYVSGEGASDARIMLVGQNPGKKEVLAGRPFVGPAGRYLDGVLARNGIDRSSVYITNVVKETTPGNRRPTADEVSRWLPELSAEIERIRPEMVVLMGELAGGAPRQPGIRYVKTCHPAAAARFPRLRRQFEQVFRLLGEEMKMAARTAAEKLPARRHRRFRLIAHTADIGLTAFGEDLPEAYANAAYGMFAIMTDLRRVRTVESRRVELAESDAELLLFEWLNHLLYHFDAHSLLFRRFAIEQFDGRSLQAVCHGEKFDPSRHEIRIGIKAATYHQLTVDPQRNRVRVIFDI